MTGEAEPEVITHPMRQAVTTQFDSVSTEEAASLRMLQLLNLTRPAVRRQGSPEKG